MEESSLGKSLGQEIPQINNHRKRGAGHQSKSQEARATGKTRVWKRGWLASFPGSLWVQSLMLQTNLERTSGME